MATNFALSSNGATAQVSNQANANFVAENLNDGFRHTNNNWGQVEQNAGGGWSATGVPATATIEFGQSRTINEIDVFTLADAVQYNTNPTLTDTFSSYGATAWTVEYWDGAAWVNIPECFVSGNNKVWRKFTFADITTTKIRVVVTAAVDNVARLVEIEAWGGGTSGGGGDTTAPTGSVVAPTAGQSVSGTKILQVSASDNVAVQSVQFKIDGANSGAAVTAQTNGYYERSLDTTTLANGNHTVSALVTDTSGNPYTIPAVTFAVNNATGGGGGLTNIPNVLADWQMNGVADSLGSNNLTNNGAVAFADGQAAFSGANHLSIADNSAIKQSSGESFEIVLTKVRLSSLSGVQTIFSKTDNSANTEYAVHFNGNTGRFAFETSIAAVIATSFGAPQLGVDYTIFAGFNFTAGKIYIRVGAGVVDDLSVSGSLAGGSASLKFGKYCNGSGLDFFFSGKIGRTLLVQKNLTAAERTAIVNNNFTVSAPAGVTFNLTAADLADNVHSENFVDYFYQNPFARFVADTTATEMTVEIFSNHYAGANPNYSKIGVVINDVYQELLAVYQAGVNVFNFQLPAGQKRVQTIGGMQTVSQGLPVRGNFLKKVAFNAAATKFMPSAAGRLLVYGDSIAVSGDELDGTRDGWTPKLRTLRNESVIVEAWGARTLLYDTETPAKLNALVASIVAANPAKIWLAIGTNDYGLNYGGVLSGQSAADFGTRYAQLLDALHAALPNVVIYVQTPLLRGTETANSFGNTLDDYRAAMSGAASSRPWATLVDGKQILTLSDMSESGAAALHPSAAGHLKYAQWVNNYLGSYVQPSGAPVASFTKSAGNGTTGTTFAFLDTSTNTPTAFSWNFGDGTSSTARNPTHRYTAPGTYTVSHTASNSAGTGTAQTQTIIVTAPAAIAGDYELRQAGLELHVDANKNNFTDLSGHGRNFTSPGSSPVIEANAVGTNRAAMRFQRTNSPLQYQGQLTIRCGWIVVKSNANFSGYDGILTALNNLGILVGTPGSNQFFDFLYDYYEFRSNDRIYPDDEAPAPVGEFAVIFFRFWTDLIVDGIQLGQDRNFADRRFDGYIAMLAIYSTGFCERDIRAQSQRIAAYYGRTLAKVIPFQGQMSDEVVSGRNANIYDPPEGDRIVEVLGDYGQTHNLSFENRSNAEFKEMREYHKAHYPDVKTAYRDYNVMPPEDIEGYIDSPLRKSGAPNNVAYSFAFKGK